MPRTLQLHINNRYDRAAPYGERPRAVLNAARFGEVEGEIRSWPDYEPTPLIELPGLAAATELGAVYYKDESQRFGLGSFKALGAAYGVLKAVQREIEHRFGAEATMGELRAGECSEMVAEITLTCATDGNHGRAVAWAAERLGCGCVVLVPSIVSRCRRDAIAEYGARVDAVDGTYDDALRAASQAAALQGRVVVSDQAYPGYESIPRDIMQGYTLSAAEVIEALGTATPLTHAFVQAGVGGFAAAICAHLWERQGVGRPAIVCVEPAAAGCLFRSARAGRMARVSGDLHTVMACLSCGEPSMLAWQILERGAAAFLTIPDEDAVRAMRLLADGAGDDAPLVAGESGVAGVAALLALARDPVSRERLGLDRASRVLVFGTEGATDPEAYESIVGQSPRDVLRGV